MSGIARSTGVPEDRVERVVEAFRKEGFLNVWQGENASSPLIDLTHEAVARQWRVLREWMLEEARARRNLQRVSDAAKDWSDHGRDRAYLFRGLQLAEAQLYLQNRTQLLGGAEKEFLDASRRAEVWNRVLAPKVVASALALLLILGALTWVSVKKADQASRQTQLARDLVVLRQSEAERAKKAEQEARLSQQSAVALQARLKEAPNSAGEAGARIYIQIRDSSQRSQAQSLSQQLKTAGFSVPGIEKVAVGPSATEIRFFRAGDEKDVKQIVEILGQQQVTAKPVLVPGYDTVMREGRYELWLAPAPEPVKSKPGTVEATKDSGENPRQGGVTKAEAAAKGGVSPDRGQKAVEEVLKPKAEAAPACGTKASFTPDSNERQKIEIGLTKTCSSSGSEAWSIEFRLISKSSSGESASEYRVQAHGNTGVDFAKIAATAKSGLDADQTKQALAAAITLRAYESGAATNAQLRKDVLDVIAVRSDSSPK